MSVKASYLSPTALLNELGISEPQDIDIEAIAQYCGATIVYEELEGCEARILGYGDRAIITINQNSPVQRQRFSAGHELGHWMCDRGKLSFSCSARTLVTSWSRASDKEWVANKYAADLLLPAGMFRPFASHREITFANVRALASLFTTSLTATAIRLVQFGSYPAAVACSDRKGRKWTVYGPEVAGRLWLHKELNPETCAYDVLINGETMTEATDVDADAWINHTDAHHYVVKEDTIKIAADLALTLLWWKDESQLVDLDKNDD